MTQADFDVDYAHRWFATELNNLAWDLIESETRSSEATERMLHAAHASTWHWLQIGTEAHHLRAMQLLANAHIAASAPESALRYAQQGMQLSTQHESELTPFDRAMTFASFAAACSFAAETHQARSPLDAALKISENLPDEERKVIQLVLARGGCEISQ